MIIFVMGSASSRKVSMVRAMEAFMRDSYASDNVTVVCNVGWDYVGDNRRMLTSWPTSKMLVLCMNPVFHDVIDDFTSAEVSRISSAGPTPRSMQRHVVRERLNQMVANLRSIGKQVYIVNSAD